MIGCDFYCFKSADTMAEPKEEKIRTPHTCSVPISQTLLFAAESCLVPEMTAGSDRPLVEKDFSGYLAEVENRFPRMRDQLSLYFSPDYLESGRTPPKLRRDLFASLVVLCGQHVELSLWTTEKIKSASRDMLRDLTRNLGCDSVEELLADEKTGILKSVLNKLQPYLLSSNWKHYPAAVTCYSWVLHKIQRPKLNDYLDSVLPTALIITDDFVPQNRIIGLKCLKHIVANVSRTELSRYGQDEVIYRAMEPILYQREAEVISPLMDCLTLLLGKMNPQNLQSKLDWNHFDDVLTLLLDSMYLEQKLVLRGAYILALGKLILAMGLSCTRHLQHILKVLDEYLLEPSTSCQALQAVDSLLEVGWPRLSDGQGRRLLVPLLKLLRDSTMELSRTSLHHRPNLAESVARTLTTLAQLCPQHLLEQIRTETRLFAINPKFQMYFQNILQRSALVGDIS